jgi:pilus assembly protein Flp/PilA
VAAGSFGAVGAGESGGAERAGLDGDAELFDELAGERVLRPLPRFDLAAGKFPEAGHGAAGRAALEQNPPLRVDQGRGDDGECRIFLQFGGQWKDSVNATLLSRADGRVPRAEKVEPMRLLAQLIRDTKAASAVEYGLICALIVIAVISGINAVASQTITMWNDVAENVNSAVQ